ncbi:hypothetical protein WJX82_011453 [Trebouxia sp. C0006]
MVTAVTSAQTALMLWACCLSAQALYVQEDSWNWHSTRSNEHNSMAPLPVPSPTTSNGHRRLAETDTPEAQSVCEFFQSGRSDPTNCCSWGKYQLCDMSDADKWIKRAAARCHDCVTSHDLCAHPPMLTIHMYLAYLDKHNPKGNLLTVKAYLLTQNLFKTQLWLWTDDPSKIINPSTQEFFDTFSDVVTVKKFVWDDEVEQTPLADHPYFGNHFQVRSDFEDFLAGYGDLVRHMLLYNHGGLWVDTDVVLLRDVYPVTMQIGYQFVMRWVNNHIYFMKQKSPLGKRILEQVRQLPFENSPKFVDEVINKTCKPKGYFAVTDSEQYRDFYNFCVFNLIKASEENKGNELDNILFDQPLGWWDQHWLGCPSLDTVHNESTYMQSISTVA